MIVIKGMEEMPKNCAECPMYQSDVDDYCDITGEWITGEEMIRHPNCPLVEIVNCEHCKHNRPNSYARTQYSCNLGHRFKLRDCENFYCADAERREHDD